MEGLGSEDRVGRASENLSEFILRRALLRRAGFFASLGHTHHVLPQSRF